MGTMDAEPQLRRRIRWGNVARVAAVALAVGLVVLWPRLRSAPPALPPAGAVPLEVAPAAPAGPPPDPTRAPSAGDSTAARRRPEPRPTTDAGARSRRADGRVAQDARPGAGRAPARPPWPRSRADDRRSALQAPATRRVAGPAAPARAAPAGPSWPSGPPDRAPRGEFGPVG